MNLTVDKGKSPSRAIIVCSTVCVAVVVGGGGEEKTRETFYIQSCFCHFPCIYIPTFQPFTVPPKLYQHPPPPQLGRLIQFRRQNKGCFFSKYLISPGKLNIVHGLCCRIILDPKIYRAIFRGETL